MATYAAGDPVWWDPPIGARQRGRVLHLSGPHGVRVNGIGPGFTMTELSRRLWEGPGSETMNAWRQENTPLRRIGLPEDMVGAAVFLASAASDFVNGQSIGVCGGYSIC